jgi:hypothetical protein
VSTVYESDSSSASFAQSVVYGVKTLGVTARYMLHRAHLRRSRLFEP